MYDLKNFIYRIKNSNVVVNLNLNPRFWQLIPIAKKIEGYSDEWWYAPTLLEYKLAWLFINIAIGIETGTWDAEDPYDVV